MTIHAAFKLYDNFNVKLIVLERNTVNTTKTWRTTEDRFILRCIRTERPLPTFHLLQEWDTLKKKNGCQSEICTTAIIVQLLGRKIVHCLRNLSDCMDFAEILELSLSYPPFQRLYMGRLNKRNQTRKGKSYLYYIVVQNIPYLRTCTCNLAVGKFECKTRCAGRESGKESKEGNVPSNLNRIYFPTSLKSRDLKVLTKLFGRMQSSLNQIKAKMLSDLLDNFFIDNGYLCPE
ncbi:hypothetical protein NQ318_005932 [Aromia moschata]|uniref:Uncharacterized protein n=1 Tax=Aromia moschata TaxID=1265417 RepID=A0AAV8XKI4_9CUCU|nr:hypothetical protein NQ318_005932 [Aromia moschata]